MRRLLFALVLLTAAPAQAQGLSATVSPDPVVFGRDSQVTWRITVTSGEQPLEVELDFSADSMSPAQRGASRWEMTHVRDREVRLEGPGTLTRGSTLIVDPCQAFTRPLPTYAHPLSHGFHEDGHGFQLELPANSETVVIVPLAIAPHAPWPGASFGLRATADGTPIELPRAAVGGRMGVPLSFVTDPPAGTNVCGERPRFPAGAVRVSGQTDPAIAGDRVTLVDVREDGNHAVGEAQVRPDGTFGLEWTPPAGDHTVSVHYAAQREDRANDFASPQWFAVDEPKATTPPPPVVMPVLLTPISVGTPRLSRGDVVVAVRCNATLGTCRGIARLRRGGRRLVARSYDVGAESVKRVRLRIPARERRLMRRGRRLRAQVVVTPEGARVGVMRLVTLRRR